MKLDFEKILNTKFIGLNQWTTGKGGCMSTPLHALRAKNVAITIATLQGMKRSKKTKDIKALERLIEELQEKLQALRK